MAATSSRARATRPEKAQGHALGTDRLMSSTHANTKLRTPPALTPNTRQQATQPSFSPCPTSGNKPTPWPPIRTSRNPRSPPWSANGAVSRPSPSPSPSHPLTLSHLTIIPFPVLPSHRPVSKPTTNNPQQTPSLQPSSPPSSSPYTPAPSKPPSSSSPPSSSPRTSTSRATPPTRPPCPPPGAASTRSSPCAGARGGRGASPCAAPSGARPSAWGSRTLRAGRGFGRRGIGWRTRRRGRRGSGGVRGVVSAYMMGASGGFVYDLAALRDLRLWVRYLGFREGAGILMARV